MACDARGSGVRRRIFGSAVVVLVVLASVQPADGYSVLTHEQLIDLSWQSTIAPTLVSRFGSLTPKELAEAHAYAYGGCAIQDLGYYPFGNQFFSDLTHYVRTGDFVRNLFGSAHNANELAFAIGALSHYIGDSVGHSQAVNPAVAIGFPKLRAKYGPSVNYAQAKHPHVQTEFAFDINQISKQRFAPSDYLRLIGMKVPREQLVRAFYETYGFRIGEILGLYRSAIRTYRFGVRRFLPAFANAEEVLHRGSFPPDVPGRELDTYTERIAQLSKEAGWDRHRKKHGFLTYLLAGLIVILPKVGPMAMLAIKVPTVDTEELYIDSVNNSTDALRFAIMQLAGPRDALAGQAMNARQVRLSSLLADRDLDTGEPVRPGGYPLTDKTYAKLLAKVTKDPTRPVPAGLKRNILHYYSNSDAPITTKKNQKQWAKVQNDIKVLALVPTQAESN